MGEKNKRQHGEHRKEAINKENAGQAGLDFFNINSQIKNRPEDEVLAEGTIRNIQYFAGPKDRRKYKESEPEAAQSVNGLQPGEGRAKYYHWPGQW